MTFFFSFLFLSQGVFYWGRFRELKDAKIWGSSPEMPKTGSALAIIKASYSISPFRAKGRPKREVRNPGQK
jgi:hypothetical protein